MAHPSTLKSNALGTNAIVVFHWLLPPTAALYYILSACIALVLGQRQRDAGRILRKITLCFVGIICIAYVLSVAFLLYLSFSQRAVISRDSIAYDANSAFIWFSLFLELSGPRLSSYFSLAGCSILYCVGEAFFFISVAPDWEFLDGPLATTATIVRGARLTIIFLLIFISAGSLLPYRRMHGETSPLLTDGPLHRNSDPNGHSDTQYGAVAWNQPSRPSLGAHAEDETDSYLRRTTFLVPFFWPQNKPLLQLLCGGVAILLLLDRALIFLLPLKLGLTIDSFSVNPGRIPLRDVVLLASLWILESTGGIPQLCKFMWSPLEEHFCFKIGTATFDRIMSLPGDFHDKTNAASLWETISQVMGARYFVRSFIFHIVPTFIDVLVALATIYWVFGTYMAMIFSASVIAVFWVSGKMLPRLLGRQGQLIHDMDAEHKCLYEATSNWPGVIYFNRIQHEKLRYRSALANRMFSSIAFSRGVYLESFVRSCLLYAGSIGLFLLAAYQIAWENKPIGRLATLIFYWTRLSSHLQMLPSIIRDSALGILSTCDLVARLKAEPSIRNQKNAKPLVVDQGNLEFQDVSFCYYGEKQVLSHVSFEAQAGQTIALVGASGSGKSTLSKLLVRMYDPHPGAITIDGQDIRDVTLESLRNNIGIVSQETIILHDTVMNNIRYANILASEEQVYEACREVGLHDLFNSLPEGYQTLLGGHGVKLSSGEQQCIAAVRMILQNPKIVFLDEATNNLDHHTESIVLRSFKKLCTGIITFKVSSRLSAISGADKILVLRHGRLIEQGDHASLLSANGYYSRLWSSRVKTKPPASLSSAAGIKVQVGDIQSTRTADGFLQYQREYPGGRTDAAMLTMNKWFQNETGEIENVQHLQNQKNAPLSMDPHERLFTDSSSLQRTMWKPDAPEFIPISQRTSAETSEDTHYPILEGQYPVIPEQIRGHHETGKENLHQAILSPTALDTFVSPVDGKVVYYETTDGDTGDSAPVLQQMDNGVVLAYPKRPRKRARKSKYRPIVRRKLTESEPIDMNFDPGQYQFPV